MTCQKVNHFFEGTRAVKVLMATKMLFLMKSIISESWDATQKIDLHLTNSSSTIVEEAIDLKPNLNVLDVDMFFSPTADEVVRLLREHAQLRETTILLTRSMLGDLAALAGSRHSDKSVDNCLARGASHFIGSLNKNSFLSLIQEYCR